MNNLIVPVYLNQRLVFDLLAMLQGGISMVTAVTRQDTAEGTLTEKAGASFGLSQALSSLLKIDLSAEKSASSEASNSNTISEERVHTPASLFYQLRNTLIEKKVIKNLDASNVEAGDIVEFEASLRRNPIIETMESLSELMSIAAVFNAEQEKPQKHVARANNKTSEYEKINAQIRSLVSSLKAGNTIDLTAKHMKSNYEAVITVEVGYLSDPTMSDIVDGKFKVVGKVTRSVEAHESINLLRKTALSKMPTAVLDQLFDALSSLGGTQGFSIPDLTLEIKGPALQIIPIAIYA